MDGPTPPAPATPPRRPAQVALAVGLVALVGLLAARGYGGRFAARPSDPAPARVDLNRADRAELGQVPHLGPKLADAIDARRRERGPFRSVDELREVAGVGPATFDKLRPFVRVDLAPVSVARAAAPDDDPPLPDRHRPATPPAPPAGARKLQPGDPPVNVNTASAADLQKLPGVGPVTAQAIVAARADRPFRTVADLDRVRGIGAKTIEKLRPFAAVE